MPEISLPSPVFPTGSGDEVAAAGLVYIGVVDEDPTVLANRVSVTVIDTDGSSVVIPGSSQPFTLNSAGMFTYDGSIVQYRTDSSYSMTVQDSSGAQLYYFPNSANTDDILTSLLQLAATSTPSSTTNVGKVYTKSSGGGIELFYMDAAGNEIQLSNGGNLNVDLPSDDVSVASLFAGYFTGQVVALSSTDNEVDLDWTAGQYFTLTNTETTTINFTGVPLIGEGIGQTIVLAIQDAGDFAITLSPEAGYTIYVRSIDNPFALTTGGLDLVFLTVYSSGNVLAVPLYDFVVLGS